MIGVLIKLFFDLLMFGFWSDLRCMTYSQVVLFQSG